MLLGSVERLVKGTEEKLEATLNQMKTLSFCRDDAIFFWAIAPPPFSWNDMGETNCTREQWDAEMPRVKFNYKLRMIVDRQVEKGAFDGETLTMKNRRHQ